MLIDVPTLAKAIKHCSLYANSCKGCTYEEKCKKSKSTNIALRDAAIVLTTFGKDFVNDGNARSKSKAKDHKRPEEVSS